MLVDLSKIEIKTIIEALQFQMVESESLDDYMAYADDEFASQDDLIGGLSVADRVDSIQNKIDEVFN